jgi:hypothetical protein
MVSGKWYGHGIQMCAVPIVVIWPECYFSVADEKTGSHFENGLSGVDRCKMKLLEIGWN